jgi:hypothetical protein
LVRGLANEAEEGQAGCWDWSREIRMVSFRLRWRRWSRRRGWVDAVGRTGWMGRDSRDQAGRVSVAAAELSRLTQKLVILLRNAFPFAAGPLREIRLSTRARARRPARLCLSLSHSTRLVSTPPSVSRRNRTETWSSVADARRGCVQGGRYCSGSGRNVLQRHARQGRTQVKRA